VLSLWKISKAVEEDLAKKAIAGEHGALETLYDRYAPALLSVCFRYTGNRDDAEDVLHDGFIKIIRKIGTFRIRQDGSLEAWMRRIIVNTALNFLRSRVRGRIFTDLDPIPDLAVTGDEEAENPDDIYRSISREKILELICDLPEGYRTVFNLHVFEAYGHREISELLGCAESTSKSQLFKARALLRKKMNQLVNKKASPIYEKI